MKIFISYCRDDADYLARLKLHLAPISRSSTIDVWDDTRIEAGDRWKREINEAITNSDVIILLISAGFFASKFISEIELPETLRRAEQQKSIVIPILVSPSRFERSELREFQAANAPSETLEDASKGRSDEILDAIAQRVERLSSTAVGTNTVATNPSSTTAPDRGASRTQPPPIRLDELDSSGDVEKYRDAGIITDHRFHAFDLFRGIIPPKLVGKSFSRCLIAGPAICHFFQPVFNGCLFGLSPNRDDNFISFKNGSDLVGSLMFDRCSFYDCTFVAIGFVEYERDMEALKSGLLSTPRVA